MTIDELLTEAEGELALARELVPSVSVKRDRTLLFRLLAGVSAKCETVKLELKKRDSTL